MKDGAILDSSPYAFPQTVFAAGGGFLEEFAYLRGIEASRIGYASDGLRISGFLVAPPGPGPFPCVIYNRGGNREFGSIDDRVVVNLLCRIASWGYLVVASQYRGACGSDGRDEFGGADVHDVLNLFPLLDADPRADRSRIGMYGGSRGGMMTYLALARTDRVRAAVLRCGVCDLTTWTDDRKDMEEVYRDLIPDFATRAEVALRERSAVYWAEKLCPTTPILIMQGSSDWRVNPRSALRMAERLLALEHPFRLAMLEGADHGLSECIPERNRLAKDWLDRFVRDGESLPDMRPHGA